MRVDALRVDARLQLVGGCCLEGDVGAYSGAPLSVFQRHRTNSVMLAIRGRQDDPPHAARSHRLRARPARWWFVTAPGSHDAVIWCLADRSITVLPITSPKARSDPSSSSLVPATRSTACCR